MHLSYCTHISKQSPKTKRSRALYGNAESPEIRGNLNIIGYVQIGIYTHVITHNNVMGGWVSASYFRLRG